MKTLALSTAAALVLTASIGSASAQTALSGKVPANCTLVTVSQPVTNPKQPNYGFRLRGAGADPRSIELCNPNGASDFKGVTPSKTAGAALIVALKGNTGTVALPNSFDVGNIDTVYCDVIDGKLFLAYYRYDWNGGLKVPMALTDRTPELVGDIETHRAGCLASMPLARKAELK